MGIMKIASSLFHSAKESFFIYRIKQGQNGKINQPRRQEIIGKVSFTPEQEKQIELFFEQSLGEKINLDWHKYYQGVSGGFAVDYMPEIYYSLYEHYVNSQKYGAAFTDKVNQHTMLNTIPGIKTAELYLFSRKGIWYNGSFDRISKQEGAEILKKVGKCFYKPINDTNSGVGCGIFSTEEKTDDEILAFLDSYDNIMLESMVKNRADIAELHPNSLNTFRIMTYRLDGEVYATPSLLRIGVGGNHVDNAHAGGIFVGIDYDGAVNPHAHTEFGGSYDKHPSTNVVFEGRRIEGFPELLETLKKGHDHFQHLDIISWDAVIDPNGDFVIIEVNLFGQSPWLPQMANGCGAFGDNTARILERLCGFMADKNR